MAEPLLEILEYQAEKDTEKKNKPSSPGQVSVEELIKKMSENEGKKTPEIKAKKE